MANFESANSCDERSKNNLMEFSKNHPLCSQCLCGYGLFRFNERKTHNDNSLHTKYNEAEFKR